MSGDDSGDSDTSSGQFTTGSDGALFGAPSVEGAATDYGTWDWKQIEAAIDGGSMLNSQDDYNEAAAISNPQSLWNAGQVFYTVQQTLAMVAQSINDQANALAGTSDAPWTGDAAQAFMTMMSSFSNNVTQNVNVLSGGAMGFSIPDQLTDNGNTLSWAQSQIESIDEWYAAEAEAQGASVVNNMVQIHEKPQLVTDMTDDMRNVLNQVASNYTDTINNVKSPSSTAPPPPGDLPPPPPIGPPPPISPPPPIGAPPPIGNPPPIGAPPPPPPIGAPPPIGNPPPIGSPPPSGTVPPPAFESTPPPGGTGPADSPLPLNALSTAPPGTGPADDGDDLPAFTSTPPPGGADAGDDLPLGSDPNLSDAPGALNPDMDSVLNPSDDLPSGDGLPGLSDAEAPLPTSLESDAPGQDGAGMPMMPSSGAGAPPALTSEPSDSSGLLSGDAAPFTGSPLDDELGSPSGAAPGEGADGMPMMPGGMGGMPSASASDPSDASGLLSGDAAPFTGSPLEDELGSPAGAAPGEGMPMMPGGMGGMPSASASDPSDASGLLSGDAAPFTSSPLEDELGSPAGATPGEGMDGMPMMPGMGSGAPGAMAGNEASDASGLLSGSAEPWEGLPALDEVGSPSGVGAGASGLVAAEVPGETDAAAAEGEPMMPMSPGMGAGAPGAAAADPSDSSGLLAGEVEEWQGEPAPDEVDAPYGVEAGDGEPWAAQPLPEAVNEEQAVALAEPAQVEDAAQEAGAWAESAAEQAEAGHAGGAHRHEDAVLGAVQVVWGQQSPDGWSAAEQPPGGDPPQPGSEPEYAAPDLPDDRVPVLGHEAASQDPSGWEVGGAAADAALFALGAWATRRRRDRDDDVHARIVSDDDGAWEDDETASADGQVELEPDGVPGVSTWRPNRNGEPAGAGSATESRSAATPGRRLRLAPPPEGYDPEVAAQQAAAATLEPADDETERSAAEEDAAMKSRGVADLLVQDPGTWGARRDDWDSM